jgi:hypothetical protein
MSSCKIILSLIVAILLVILLSSCNGGQSVPPTPVPSTATVVPPTKTPLLMDTPQPTATPTSTERATITPTISPTPSPPPYFTPTIPRETLAALATLDSLVTQVPNLGEFYTWECMLYPCYTSGLGLSPNGLWAAFFSANESGGLKIVSVDGTKQWEVYFSELTGIPCPCGDALVAIDHWSSDGRYIYLYPDMQGDGGYDWVWNKQAHLIRLDLFSGYWIDTQMGNSYSFSPDDQFIAYRFESGVHIHDLSTREELVFPVSAEFIDFGRFVWSPDGSRLIFAAGKEDLNLEEQEEGLTVFLLSLSDSSVISLFEDDLRYLCPMAWPEQNQVIFKSLYERQTYYFNLETGELMPVAWPVTR